MTSEQEAKLREVVHAQPHSTVPEDWPLGFVKALAEVALDQEERLKALEGQRFTG